MDFKDNHIVPPNTLNTFFALLYYFCLIKNLLMKNLLFALVLISWSISAQNSINPSTPAKPKLVVGIVVDQMRWDYLYRFADKYGNGGFKRLQSGYNCENTHIPYIPTYTAPGHTCIYTGSVPAIHGIIGNNWYSREAGTSVYCTEDTTCRTVGATGEAGQMSPRRMLTTTITDELRLASNFQSKVIGIAIKDRGAILPAGHSANGAYWFDGKSGNWISSTYYGTQLPKWADEFNARKIPAKYLTENWKTILDLKLYTESSADNEPYEKAFKKETNPTFPHQTSEMMEKNVDVIRATPWGNTMTFDFAKAAIVGENMGTGSSTDFLALSCSSTDYIGHQFGPNSIEIEDCYIRFDRDLADFLSYLDTKIGKGNYLVFLTADHGAGHADGFNKEHHIPADVVDNDQLMKTANLQLKEFLGIDSLILACDNMQFYLREHTGDNKPTDMAAVKNLLIKSVMQNNRKTVKTALDLRNIAAEPIPAMMRESIINGYNAKRSGDIQLIYEPADLENADKGTTHGTLYNYDTHIPLLWYGWGIKSGHDYSPAYMTDIAATLAALLHIQEPNGCIGKPLAVINK